MGQEEISDSIVIVDEVPLGISIGRVEYFFETREP